jgi:hypothetical protein
MQAMYLTGVDSTCKMFKVILHPLLIFLTGEISGVKIYVAIIRCCTVLDGPVVFKPSIISQSFSWTSKVRFYGNARSYISGMKTMPTMTTTE